VTGIKQEKERERMTRCGKYPIHKISLRKIPMTNVTTSQKERKKSEKQCSSNEIDGHISLCM